jgi:hypothetical protein
MLQTTNVYGRVLEGSSTGLLQTELPDDSTGLRFNLKATDCINLRKAKVVLQHLRYRSTQ